MPQFYGCSSVIDGAEDAAAALIRVLQDLGADSSNLLAVAGLSDVKDASGVVCSDGSFTRLGQLAVPQIEVLTCRREALRPMTKNAFRLLCTAMLGCPDLRTAIEITSLAFGELHRFNGGLILKVEGREAMLYLDLGRRIYDAANLIVTIYALSTYHRFFGWLVNRDLDVTYVGLAFPENVRVSALEMLLPIEPEFNLLDNVLRFDSACLSFPIARSYSELQDLLAVFSYMITPPVYNVESVRERVQAIFMAAMSGDRNIPDSFKLSRMLGISESTLRRRLADEGCSLTLIRNYCRQRVAIRLLRETAMSVTEIAARVRFQDVASFSRAFQGWTGMPPTLFRAQRGNDTGA